MSVAPVQQQQSQENRTPKAALRSQAESLPTVGDAGLARQQRQPARASQMRPAGASPAPPTVSIAQLDADASSMLSPIPTAVTRSGQARGAQITGQTSSQVTEAAEQASVGGAELARSQLAARAGMPDVQAGNSLRAPGRARRANAPSGFAPLGAPDPGDAMAAAPGGTDGSGPGDEIQDRMGLSDLAAERSDRPGGADASSLANAGAASLALDILAEEGPIGFADRVTASPGLMPLEDQPSIAAFEFPNSSRPRRDVGGPATPAGTKIAAVESFSRRVMRTSGTAAPAPAGMAGPATEEAIERGLAVPCQYSKRGRQLVPAGSWRRGSVAQRQRGDRSLFTGVSRCRLHASATSVRRHGRQRNSVPDRQSKEQRRPVPIRKRGQQSKRCLVQPRHRGACGQRSLRNDARSAAPRARANGAQLHLGNPASRAGRLAIHASSQRRHQRQWLDDDGAEKRRVIRIGSARQNVSRHRSLARTCPGESRSPRPLPLQPVRSGHRDPTSRPSPHAHDDRCRHADANVFRLAARQRGDAFGRGLLAAIPAGLGQQTSHPNAMDTTGTTQRK